MSTIIMWVYYIMPTLKQRKRIKQKGGDLEQETKDTSLLDAFTDNNFERMKSAINSGANVNVKDRMGWPLLIKAVFKNKTEVVKLLLENGADVNAKTEDGLTSLMMAYGNIEIMTLLLELGADVNAKTKDGRTSLMIGIKNYPVYENFDGIKLLLEKGADVNAKNSKNETAITLASGIGIEYPELIPLLKLGVLDIAPKCMSQEEYTKCINEGDDKPIDPITLEPVDREDAVKLEGQPNVCYDRKSLRTWLKNNKTNPMTRSPISDDWIRLNMVDKKCEEENMSGAGSKRKRKTIKRRKSNKLRKTNRKK